MRAVVVDEWGEARRLTLGRGRVRGYDILMFVAIH